MLVYVDDWSAWNGVQVLVDGQMQHGQVINVAEGGLIIDFGCTARRSQFIEYGRIFHYDSKEMGRSKTDVQVLLRYHPNDAWTWFPGRWVPAKFDDSAYDDYADFVEVQLPHGTVTELLPSKQLRTADPQQLPVMRDDFVIRCCPLPAVRWSEEPHGLAQMLKRVLSRHLQCDETLCTTVLSQAILYLQRQTHTPLTTALLEEMYKRGCDRRCTSQPLVCHTGPSCSPPRKRRKVDETSLPLPAELLVEVFQAQDSIERVRCRRVCPLWNSLLTTESYFTDVRVSGKDAYYGAVPFNDGGMFWWMAGLQKCLRPATMVAVIMHVDGDRTRNAAEPINHTFSASRRLPTLMFKDCDFGYTGYNAHAVIDFTAEEAVHSVCERIVWKQCRIVTCTDLSTEPRPPITIGQHTFSVRSREDMEMQLFALVERAFVLPQPLHLPTLAVWIANAVADNPERHVNIREYDIKIILNTLNVYQSADPRLTTQYRDRKWTVSHLADLDVTRLTTLTAAFLAEVLTPCVKPNRTH
ncbi:uncharacterized protein LOC129600251 [Paramacrobiotus metropolitanus]|uniref:uncharacterized protein LOC129600251 n=1 Tax=Paramacrobiotus metropolitanus TaxID=2943436 RepID=UPI0024461ACB|nr:uncharacterized protein LOC129600251 [Paramacrobiotus metropolitanus]